MRQAISSFIAFPRRTLDSEPKKKIAGAGYQSAGFLSSDNLLGAVGILAVGMILGLSTYFAIRYLL